MLAYRRWLGWDGARVVRQPRWLIAALSGMADIAGSLGWRPPVRTTARVELARGATGDGSEWRRITGIVPQPLAEALARAPASVQERWFAKLYLLKPLVLGMLALYWIATALLPFGPAWDASMRFTTEDGLNPRPLVAIAAAVVNIAVGVAIAMRRTARPALLVALGLTILHLVIATLFAPDLWLDLRGPLLREVPLVGLNLAALAILDER